MLCSLFLMDAFNFFTCINFKFHNGISMWSCHLLSYVCQLSNILFIPVHICWGSNCCGSFMTVCFVVQKYWNFISMLINIPIWHHYLLWPTFQPIAFLSAICKKVWKVILLVQQWKKSWGFLPLSQFLLPCLSRRYASFFLDILYM